MRTTVKPTFALCKSFLEVTLLLTSIFFLLSAHPAANFEED